MHEQELKQKLLAEADKAIDKLLQEKPEPDEATFSELEDWVGDLGKQIEQATLSQLVDVEEKPQGGVRCPECGGTAQNKELKKRQVVSLRGTVEIERRYYYCGQCQQGFFSPR
jgi:hypothetical protein